jgi:hypothetical protein
LQAEVVEVNEEAVLAEMIRSWVTEQLPGEPAAADRAAFVAVAAHRHGEDLSDACQEARRFVKSWADHPSHQRNHNRVPIAS